jgi:hypothetical protein
MRRTYKVRRIYHLRNLRQREGGQLSILIFQVKHAIGDDRALPVDPADLAA